MHIVNILMFDILEKMFLAEYLDIKTTSFVTKEYIQPLVDAGKLKLTTELVLQSKEIQ